MNTTSLKEIFWQPPENFTQVESAVEGISVFAPVARKEISDEIKTFKCPNCGATTHYNVAAGGIACEYCGYTATIQSKKVGTDAKEFEFTLETLSQAQNGWGGKRKTLVCENCGAVSSIPENLLSATCPFCASNKVNLSTAPAEILRPRFLIPFKLQRGNIKKLAKAWLDTGWFHPKELAANTIIEKFTGVYLPYWTFDALIQASWKAQVGHERTVRDKDGNTRTVIDWRWENGQASINIDDLMICGSSHISHFILEQLLPFNLKELTTYSPDYLAGWQAHHYDIALPAAWDMAKEQMRSSAKTTCRSQIHSSHVRNFTMTGNFTDEAWRYIFLPVYIASYRHEDRIFQIMVNGQNGVVAGQKPVEWWKIWLAIGAMLVPGLMLGLIGLPLLLAGGIGTIPLILGFVLLAIGGILSFLLYQKAVNSERA